MNRIVVQLLPLCALLLSSPNAFAQRIGVWETRAPLPIRATEVSAAVIDGKVYVVCGILPNLTRSDRLFIYDPFIDAWSEGAAMPVAGDHCNVAAVDGKLYVASGLGFGSRFGETFAYNPQTDLWASGGRMGVPRGASGTAAIGGKIYVAGGQGSPGAGTAFEVFDTVDRTWTQLPDLPTSRNHLTAQAVDGKFYAIAGRSGGINSVLATNEEFDPASNTWSSRAPMPTARGGLGSGVIGGRIQVIGGEGPSGTADRTYEQNEEYDPATDTWRTLAPMPTPRHGFYGATMVESSGGGRLFVPGGGPQAGGAFSDAHEVFFLPSPDAPAFDAEGVVSAASFEAKIAPGSIVSLFGSGLSLGSQMAVALPLPTSMNTVSVTIDGEPAPLFFVSPGQVNFHLNSVSPGEKMVAVNSGGVSSPAVAVPTVIAAPAIFTLTQEGQGAVLIAGTGLVAGDLPDVPSRPARRGEAIEIFATGFGFLESSLLRSGDPPELSQERPEIAPGILVGGVAAQLLFSGPAPGLVGVDQVNALIPEEAPSGDAVELVISLGDARSNPVTIGIAP